MRRVVVWVDGISHGTVSVARFSCPLRLPPATPDVHDKSTNKRQIPLSSKFNLTSGSLNYTPLRDPTDAPTLYYSSSPSVAGRSNCTSLVLLPTHAPPIEMIEAREAQSKGIVENIEQEWMTVNERADHREAAVCEQSKMTGVGA
ncbi:hypothetical protein BGW80DRAFT_717320 [Lactifluus volemus]|nr:hypothetical protein BGW80DRAFT_717320 [Lactifluus volemus]